MEAKDRASILQQILRAYPGTDPEMDVDWDMMEISFKAGQETERLGFYFCEEHKLYYCDCCPDCFEERGRKEVVEWIREHGCQGRSPVWLMPLNGGVKTIKKGEWQAKLKDWGIE